MIECLILGDSLAVGIGQARPGCETVARSGITSGSYLRTLFPSAPRIARHVVISLGVNDDPGMATPENLRTLRRGLQAMEVVWLLPGLKPGVRATIRAVAADHGDRLLDSMPFAGPDRLHPGTDGYRMLAARFEAPGGVPADGARPAPAPALPALAALPAAPARRPAGGPGLRPWAAPAWTPMLPGGVYGAWPPVGSGFAAVPPGGSASVLGAWPR